jgi:hypothetical protein
MIPPLQSSSVVFCGPVLSLSTDLLAQTQSKFKTYSGCFSVALLDLAKYMEDGVTSLTPGKPVPISCTVHAKVLGDLNKNDFVKKEDVETVKLFT